MWWLWLLLGIAVVFGFVVFRGAPYVPSRKRELVDAFDKLYPLGSKDTLVDIGSGDGIVLREAARRGARAIGYELNPVLVLISRLASHGNDLIKTQLADFWLVQLPADTTVVYAFGESRDIAKMAKKVEAEAVRLGRNLHFISYGFAVPGTAPVKKVGAYYLYQFAALHTGEA